ncbi:SgcJ/EcaC family oxidoreductase [Saccharomonospora saliphila]|uniref:SgcJ/EcaC family oxidoreductase n=1 Tax=Saccharomonospora saliphila TaxID=369829 RepID=UPI00037087F4|nr:SgcJ/EcaC family oxidoreductase [Saccharomonospora saliphila]
MDADTARHTEADERAIHELVSRAQELQNDPGLLDLHTPDAVIVNIAGRRVLGREAFAEAMRGALTSPLSDVTTSLEVVDIRFATPEVAIVSCVKTVHDNRSDAAAHDALPTSGALTYVLTRSQRRWRIAAAQTTPIRAAASAHD